VPTRGAHGIGRSEPPREVVPGDRRRLLRGDLKGTVCAERSRLERAPCRLRHLAREPTHPRQEPRHRARERGRAQRGVLQDRGGPARHEPTHTPGERPEACEEPARAHEQVVREHEVRALVARGPAERAGHHLTRGGAGLEPLDARVERVRAVAHHRQLLALRREQVEALEFAAQVAVRGLRQRVEVALHLGHHRALARRVRTGAVHRLAREDTTRAALRARSARRAGPPPWAGVRAHVA
jgi:hypothetical protein